MGEAEEKQRPPQPILIQGGADPKPQAVNAGLKNPAPAIQTPTGGNRVSQTAIKQYRLTLSTKPNSTGFIVLGLVFLLLFPFFLLLSSANSNDALWDAAGLCCGSILIGIVVLLVAASRDAAWQTQRKRAERQIMSEAGLEVPKASKTPLIATFVFGVLWLLSPVWHHEYNDVIRTVTFVLFIGAAIIAQVNESKAKKTLKYTVGHIIEQQP